MPKCSCGVVPGDCYDACGARESKISDLIRERDELRSCLSRAIEMSDEAWSDLTYRERAMLKPTIDQWRKAVVGK